MTCPAAVGGQAEQRSARVKRDEGGTARATLRVCRGPPYRSTSTSAQQSRFRGGRAQWSTTVKWIDCYPTHTDERGNSWRARREGGRRMRTDGRTGGRTDGRTDGRSHQSEWMGRGLGSRHVSPFRGRPNIKLICPITPEQLSLTPGWKCLYVRH